MRSGSVMSFSSDSLGKKEIDRSLHVYVSLVFLTQSPLEIHNEISVFTGWRRRRRRGHARLP